MNAERVIRLTEKDGMGSALWSQKFVEFSVKAAVAGATEIERARIVEWLRERLSMPQDEPILELLTRIERGEHEPK